MKIYLNSGYVMTRKLLICALLLTAIVLPTQQAQAFILSVTPNPSSSNVAIGHTFSTSINWNVVGGGQGPLGATVTSQQSAFFIQTGQGNVTLANVNTSLNKANPGAPSLRIRERILIPASIIAKARSHGVNQFFYARVFSDGNLPVTGSMPFNITGSAGAGFSISREALSFTDQ